ncbi:sodium channel%2C voltage-gated, type IV, beta a [Scomber scombrus]|uniref:Sodium channel, voltage-gated, type IV, beta a n=1 Tax=Scomber scombrus TaxID=13677 RepID=A0AAV1P114_SCOSC
MFVLSQSLLCSGVWSVGGLEVSTGKVNSIEALNGSTVLLPCTFTSCVGIKNLYFDWHYNDNGTMIKLCEGKIPDDKKEPSANVSHKRLEFVGSSKNKNISILLWNITFEDDGKYICFARNPKENNRNHSATFTLKVVDQSLNGSTVLLPCTYSSCIGIKNLYVSWRYNDNGTILKLCEAVIPIEGEEPMVFVYQERVEFVGSSKSNDISMLLWNITFEDEGEYICFARNPKEKGRDHSATFTLKVVDQLKEVDNTLTTIIVSVLGGVIGLVIIVMVIKSLVVHT